MAKVLLSLVILLAAIEPFNLEQFWTAYARWPIDGPPTTVSRFGVWDAAHYLILSQIGYEPGSPSCAFYPLWPAAIHAVSTVTYIGPLLTSMLLTNALSLLGLWLLYRLVERHCGPAISRDALILLLAFPGALFFSFPYTESLYLVLLMAFFWGLEVKRWWWVAAAGFLLPLTRAVGVFIVLPLAWYLYEQQRTVTMLPARGGTSEGKNPARDNSSVGLVEGSNRRESALIPSAFRGNGLVPAAKALMGMIAHRRWLLLLCPILGYAAYFGLMYLWTGNAFEGFEAQKSYPNKPSIKNMFNLPAFTHALLNVGSLDGMMDSALDRGCFLLFLALLPAVWKRNRTWFWYVLPAGLIPALTSYFMSYRRYIMVLFPIIVVVALKLRKAENPWLFWYYVILLATLQVWAVKQFINFNWAG